MVLLITLLIISILPSFTLSSEFYNNKNQTITVDSFYTTLGILPKDIIIANITFINNSHITPNCELEGRIKKEGIRGRVIIYVGEELPLLYKCCSDIHGMNAAFAKIIQSFGAVGLISSSFENVYFILFFFYFYFIYFIFQLFLSLFIFLVLSYYSLTVIRMIYC